RPRVCDAPRAPRGTPRWRAGSVAPQAARLGRRQRDRALERARRAAGPARALPAAAPRRPARLDRVRGGRPARGAARPVPRACGLSIFETHARACAGTLPAFDVAAACRTTGAVGKAIVYARRDVTAPPDTRAWLEDESVRDVPAPGEWIARGRPICTIFARGA